MENSRLWSDPGFHLRFESLTFFRQHQMSESPNKLESVSHHLSVCVVKGCVEPDADHDFFTPLFIAIPLKASGDLVEFILMLELARIDNNL